MKKIITAFLAILIILALTACAANSGGKTPEGNKKTDSANSQPNGEKTGQGESDEIDLSGIPQYWIDLFTFDNVTILLKNNLTIKRGDEYRCVGGKWNVKYQGTDGFEAHSGRYIYDLYLLNHSIFSYDEENSRYRASNATLDENGYLRDITISVENGKILSIVDTATLNSSVIVSTLDFSDYGTTVVE